MMIVVTSLPSPFSLLLLAVLFRIFLDLFTAFAGAIVTSGGTTFFRIDLCFLPHSNAFIPLG